MREPSGKLVMIVAVGAHAADCPATQQITVWADGHEVTRRGCDCASSYTDEEKLRMNRTMDRMVERAVWFKLQERAG